ncbi:MAG: lipase family protein [Oscillospiraceae bacterium]|nr:lipase family protein [Oscillospiraceae bacterium]
MLQPVYGALTYADLTRADLCFAPDPFQPELARMSAELSANVYTLSLNAWRAAGWGDAQFILRRRVMPLGRDDASVRKLLRAEWRQFRAKAQLRGARPIGDAVRTVRALLAADMGKSVVMARPLDDGRAVVAVSFIGTTRKLYDWLANFHAQPESGVHAGFLAMARQFDAQAARIPLPGLSEAIGMPAPTLADAIKAAQDPTGRVCLWLSGHSQGGALAQVYARLLIARGVAPERLRGYTFGAPRVALEAAPPLPIYNLINADDLIPRLGAQTRWGNDRIFWPDEAFRAAHYRVPQEVAAAFARVRWHADAVRTMRDALAWGMALLGLVRGMGESAAVADFVHAMTPKALLLGRVGIDLPELAQHLQARLGAYIQAHTGDAPDEALIVRYREGLLACIAEFGAEATARALGICLSAPHRIRPDKKDEAFVPTYVALVRGFLGEMGVGENSPDLPMLYTIS